jgi:hypothetical protein
MKINSLATCHLCASHLVTWNWFYIVDDPPSTKPHRWGHECWSCENCFETLNEIQNGIPHWILKNFYRTPKICLTMGYCSLPFKKLFYFLAEKIQKS